MSYRRSYGEFVSRPRGRDGRDDFDGRRRRENRRSRSRSRSPAAAPQVDNLVLTYKCKSYAQFSDSYPPETPTETIEAKYAEYKSQWEVEASSAFFHVHHTEDWLRQRYHPSLVAAATEKRNRWAVHCAEALVREAVAGTDAEAGDLVERLAGTQLMASTGGDSTLTPAFRTYDDLTVVNPKCTLALKNLPPLVKASDIEQDAVVKTLDGLRAVYLSDPSTVSKAMFRRSAWLVFDRPSQAADAKEALNLHQLHLSIPVDELLKQMNRIKVAKALEVKDAADTDAPQIQLARLWSKLMFDTVFDKSAPASTLLKAEWYSPRSTIQLPSTTSAPDQIDRDLTRALQLATALDDSVGMAPGSGIGALLAALEYRVLADVQKLDLIVFYLAQVHWYEYYSGVQHDSVGALLDNWRPYTRTQYEPESFGGDVDTTPHGGGTDEAPAVADGGDVTVLSGSESDGEQEEEGAAEDASKSQRKERESLDMRLASAANVRLQELEAAKVAREEAERAKPRDPIDFPAIMEQNTSADNTFGPSFVKELGLLKDAVLGCVHDDEYLRPLYDRMLRAIQEPDSNIPEDECKHRCKCDKLFKNRVYAIKHVHNKHVEEATVELTRVKSMVTQAVDISLYQHIIKFRYLADSKRVMPRQQTMSHAEFKSIEGHRARERDVPADHDRDRDRDRLVDRERSPDRSGGDRGRYGRGDHRPSFQRDRRGDDGGRRGGGRGRVPFVAGPPRFDREAAAAQAVAEAAAKKVDYTSLILDYSDI